eukprot:s4488_g5.t1
MVKWWQVGGSSNADIADAADVARAVQPAEATWRVQDDWPFFDSRLVVETSAQFVAASFRIRAGQTDLRSPRSESKAGSKPQDDDGFQAAVPPQVQLPALRSNSKSAAPRKRPETRDFRLRHAACCHAHHFVGFERLATELVPRSRDLRDQLRQTLWSLCVLPGNLKSAAEVDREQLDELIESEVERYLRSRLVICQLTDVMTQDLIAKYNSDSDTEEETGEEGAGGGVEGKGLFNIATMAKSRGKAWKDALFGDVGGRRGPAPVHPLGAPVNFSKNSLAKRLQMMSINSLAGKVTGAIGQAAGSVADAARQAARNERRQRAKEKGMRQFEHRFFRAFTTGLGQSLFGDREDLVFRFEVAALNVLHTYQGELPLALHSLMGWLPAHVSNSLFVVVLGLPALVASKQTPDKFGMLLNCVNCIANGSGRYVFVSTPSWYLPLSARIGGLGRLHEIRERSLALCGRPVTSVQAVWPSPCEPQEVLEAVDAVWGGRQPGVRAALGLCGGVEAMGEWVLRMTMGCEGLLIRALEVLKTFAPTCEAAYDELADEGKFQSHVEVPASPVLARCMAEVAAELVAHRARRRRRLQASDLEVVKVRSAAEIAFKRGASQTCLKRSQTTAVQEPAPPEPKEHGTRRGEKPNILAQLQRGDINSDRATADEHSQHLRRSVLVGSSGVRLPVGVPGRMGGRIPIHDSPKLRPDIAAPIVEDVNLDEVAPLIAATAATKLQRTRTAPQLRHPKSFAEQLAEMAALSKRSHQDLKRRRARSAPAQVDTQDFDAGNVMKNTAVALALQDELSKVLSMECSEGPLNLFWRQGRDEGESAELIRLRFNVGALLLFAAQRSALPPGLELPLKYFAATETIGIKEEKPSAEPQGEPGGETPDLEKGGGGQLNTTTLADGAFAMGFSVIFHSMPSSHFARTSPLGAGAFHVGLPHAMLEALSDVLTQRCVGPLGENFTVWTNGSLIVLLSAYLLQEEHVASRHWTRLSGWLQQQHSLFFSSSCCLRVLLAFELLMHYYAKRPDDKLVRLKEVLPFLSRVMSKVKDLPAKLDMCADYCQRPLLHAPKIASEMPGSLKFDPHFAEWGKEFVAGGLAVDMGVPLMDFAKWVGNLKPGRIVYSSPNTCPHWDLLLRLNWSVVILSFVVSKHDEISPEQLFRRYRRSVGEKSWWGKRVRTISYILVGDRLGFELENLFASTSQKCVEIPGGCAVPGGTGDPGAPAGHSRRKVDSLLDDAVDDEMEDEEEEEEMPEVDHTVTANPDLLCIEETEKCDFMVRPDTEILLCKAPDCLERLLGPMAGAVLGHRASFHREISQEVSGDLQREVARRRAELNRARWSQDKGKLAVRQPLPTASDRQLTFNAEALRSILDHIGAHTSKMLQMAEEIGSDSEDNSALGSCVSSVVPLPALGPIKVPDSGEIDKGEADDTSESRSSSSLSSQTASSLSQQSQSLLLNPALALGQRRRSSVAEEQEEVDIEENPPARRRASLHWAELRQSAKIMLMASRIRKVSRIAAAFAVPKTVPEEVLQDVDLEMDAQAGKEQGSTGIASFPVEEDAAEVATAVHFSEDMQEPQRTDKRQLWRPPTPHPIQSAEAARRTNPALQRAFQESLEAPRQRVLKFDWLGWEEPKKVFETDLRAGAG